MTLNFFVGIAVLKGLKNMSLKKMNILKEQVSVDLLRESVIYNEKTGEFRWRQRPIGHFGQGRPTPERRAAMWNAKYAGKLAFTSKDPRGYFRGALRGRSLYAHRAAMAILNGEWPNDQVDHINRDKSDNRIINLRIVSHSENRINTLDVDLANEKRRLKIEKRGNRKRTAKGIRRQSKKSWSARLTKSGKEIHLGSFYCFGEAVKARLDAECLR